MPNLNTTIARTSASATARPRSQTTQPAATAGKRFAGVLKTAQSAKARPSAAPAAKPEPKDPPVPDQDRSAHTPPDSDGSPAVEPKPKAKPSQPAARKADDHDADAPPAEDATKPQDAADPQTLTLPAEEPANELPQEDPANKPKTAADPAKDAVDPTLAAQALAAQAQSAPVPPTQQALPEATPDTGASEKAVVSDDTLPKQAAPQGLTTSPVPASNKAHIDKAGNQKARSQGPAPLEDWQKDQPVESLTAGDADEPRTPAQTDEPEPTATQLTPEPTKPVPSAKVDDAATPPKAAEPKDRPAESKQPYRHIPADPVVAAASAENRPAAKRPTPDHSPQTPSPNDANLQTVGTSPEPASAPSPAPASVQPPDLAALQAMTGKPTDPLAAPAALAPAPPPPAPLPNEADFAAQNHPTIVKSMAGTLLPKGGAMQLRLDPPELGPLQINVQVNNGIVTATFQTADANATHLLSHTLAQLKQSLEMQGITVEKLQVQQAPKQESAGQHSSSDDPRQATRQGQGFSEEQRRETLRRLWRKARGEDPLDVLV